MSSIRLFILGALAIEGDMHGHQLRNLAQLEHIDEWTDISVGGLYGAIKRLAAEGLIAEVRVEREGAYPERQVWTITDTGLVALRESRLHGLTEIVIKPDPFDLAMSRLDPEMLDELPGIIAARLDRLRQLLAQTEAKHAHIAQYLTMNELFVMTHKVANLRADIDWHEQLADRLPRIITDEKSRKN